MMWSDVIKNSGGRVVVWLMLNVVIIVWISTTKNPEEFGDKIRDVDGVCTREVSAHIEVTASETYLLW